MHHHVGEHDLVPAPNATERLEQHVRLPSSSAVRCQVARYAGRDAHPDPGAAAAAAKDGQFPPIRTPTPTKAPNRNPQLLIIMPHPPPPDLKLGTNANKTHPLSLKLVNLGLERGALVVPTPQQVAETPCAPQPGATARSRFECPHARLERKLTRVECRPAAGIPVTFSCHALLGAVQRGLERFDGGILVR